MEQVYRPAYLTDLIKIVWNRARGYKLLVAGSGAESWWALCVRVGWMPGVLKTTAPFTAQTPKALKKF